MPRVAIARLLCLLSSVASATEKPNVLFIVSDDLKASVLAPADYLATYPIEKITRPTKLPGDQEDIPRAGRNQNTSRQCGIDQFPDNQKRMWAGDHATVTLVDEQVGRLLTELMPPRSALTVKRCLAISAR